MLLLFVIFSCFSCVFSSKFCYDCSPEDYGNCLSPIQNNIKTTDCETQAEEQQTISTVLPLEFECFTLLTENGTYRGCVESRNEVCTYLTDQYRQYGIVKCDSCSSDKCNSDNLLYTDEDPNNDDGNGAAELSLSIGVVILNVLCLARILQ